MKKEKKLITLKEAKEVWKEMKNNEFVLIHYSSFEDYWKECERINNLPFDEWQDLVNENEKKLKAVEKLWKRN